MQMRRSLLLTGLILLALPGANAQVVRRSVVMHTGQQLHHAAAAPLLTVQTPPGREAETRSIVEAGFEQYGQRVLLEAKREGMAKLLLEKTDSTIGEILHVIVTDQATAERYRRVSAEMAGIEGISPQTVLVAGRDVLITGRVYSTEDQTRCLSVAASQSEAKGRVTCAVRLASAVPVVFPDKGYEARPSAELREEASAISGVEPEGLEGPSRWTLWIRFGDVPVLALQSLDRADLIQRAVAFSSTLERALIEWKQEGARREVFFPGTFHVREASSGYELRMQWKFDQGTRGELLATIRPEELQGLGSNENAARLLRWWAALLQDTFRMYYLAQSPSRTLAEGQDDAAPLLKWYEHALELQPELNRQTAPVALARSHFAMWASSGGEPFNQLLIRPPSRFAAEVETNRESP